MPSACCATSALVMAGVSGPIELPSPITSSVTHWRISPNPRPSINRASVDQLRLLLKPGATALPVATHGRRPVPQVRGQITDMRHARQARKCAGKGKQWEEAVDRGEGG